MEELVPLPGVGRKTANASSGNAFDTPGIPVDMHVGRPFAAWVDGARRSGESRDDHGVDLREWTMFAIA